MSVLGNESRTDQDKPLAVGEGPVTWFPGPRPWFGVPFPSEEPGSQKALTLEAQTEVLREAIANHLRYTLAKYQVLATPRN